MSYSRGRNVYVPVASRRYIEEHGMPLHPKDLAAHTVLVYDGSVRSATRYLENGDKREEVKWKQVLRVSNILAIKKSVIDGLGISVDLPLFTAHRKLPRAFWSRFFPAGSIRRWSALCALQNKLAHPPPPRISAVVPNAPGSIFQKQRRHGGAFLGHPATHHRQRNLESSGCIDRIASLHRDRSGFSLKSSPEDA